MQKYILERKLNGILGPTKLKYEPPHSLIYPGKPWKWKNPTIYHSSQFPYKRSKYTNSLTALRSKINYSEAHKYIREMKEINALLESTQVNKTPIKINIGKFLNPKVLFNYIYILFFSYTSPIVKINIWEKWKDIEKVGKT